MFQTPILFLIFNRLDTTQQVFAKIREIQPKHLYIAADGPRKDKEGEAKICEQVKQWVLQNIDWDCKVISRFQENNQGCGKHVSGAITWFFEHVEEGIILEDDCVPDVSFFKFCAELLEKYRDNQEIFVIGGTNFQKSRVGNASYYFSAYGLIWGWATWKRAWKKYIFNLKSYNDNEIYDALQYYFKTEREISYWNSIYTTMKYNPIDTWDHQWLIAQWFNKGINIVPNVNLVSNIGFDERATHTKHSSDKLSNNNTKSLEVITHPSKIRINRKADLYSFDTTFQPQIQPQKKPFFVEVKRLLQYIILPCKNKIIQVLSNYFQKIEPQVYYNNNPFNITLGKGSYIEKPKRIDGGSNILIGSNSSIGYDAWIGAIKTYQKQSFNPKIIIGNNVRIGNYSCITSISKIEIEEGCLFSEYVYISDHYHGFDPEHNVSPIQQDLFTKGDVIIGKNCFIGYRVTILSGVTLGNNCVVGAHSVVTKSFPAYSMIAGVPAKIIKTYSHEKKQWIAI